MVVQHNLQAMNANRMLGITAGTLSKSAEKLSSGYKVNRAADDAAGLAISEKMRKQIRGLTQASTNAEDGISAVQTAEGALTEVHDMLQRLNELAVKASNGTNSISDRQTVQDEVDQLLTEIDRVSETTKFNEIYLLKGERDTKTVSINAQDAGIDGKLTQNTTTATLVINQLKLGDSIKIGGKEYSIGGATGDIQATLETKLSAGSLVTIDGTQYKVAMDDESDVNPDKNTLTRDNVLKKIADGSKVVYQGKTFVSMTTTIQAGKTIYLKDSGASAVDYESPEIITTTKAYEMIAQEFKVASSIGADTAAENAKLDGDKFYKVGAPEDGKVTFQIEKAKVDRKEGLTFALHVGADADMNNKITVSLDALDTRGLGISGLNVKDSTGTAATYAIDAIADAVAHVSAQRSLLGAIQNRLEHTINNLDNVVENTTSAESQIRDTDMATEMVKYSNNNILQQAGQSMLAQANQANQGVLSLLG